MSIFGGYTPEREAYTREVFDRLQVRSYQGEGLPGFPCALAALCEYGVVIGTGGMCYVARLKDARTGHNLAMKILQRWLAASHPHILRRESAILRMFLDQPHIIRWHGYAETKDGDPAVLMEEVQGRTLYDLACSKWGPSLPTNRVYAFFEQCLEAVRALHRTSIAHRDLKLMNFMVDGRECVKLIDFSAATHVWDFDEDVICGTPEYHTPETALGCIHPLEDDLFALTLILVEMLRGEFWEELDLSRKRMLPEYVYKDRMRRLHDLRTAAVTRFGRKVGRFIRRGVHPDPRKRFSSIEEMVAAFSRVRGK